MPVALALLLFPADGRSEDPLRWIHLKLGGMRPGSGVGGGVELHQNRLFDRSLRLRLESKASIRLYQEHEAELIVPRLLASPFFVELLATYRSDTQVDFFGIGPGSREEDHSDYRNDYVAAFATLGLHPQPNLRLGFRGGYLRARIRAGTDDDLPGIEERFGPESLPGLSGDPSHLLLGPFVVLDLRDDAEDPSSGAYYEVQSTHYEDLGLDRYSFWDVDFDARHFLSLGRRWTLALRVAGTFTGVGTDQAIPFYLLPTLGGSDDLVAFENDRFRDRHRILLNDEIRFRATRTVRLTLFAGAGEVFPSVDAFRLKEVAFSYGGGVVYELGTAVLVNASVGIGREGPRLALRGDFRF